MSTTEIQQKKIIELTQTVESLKIHINRIEELNKELAKDNELFRKENNILHLSYATLLLLNGKLEDAVIAITQSFKSCDKSESNKVLLREVERLRDKLKEVEGGKDTSYETANA